MKFVCRRRNSLFVPCAPCNYFLAWICMFLATNRTSLLTYSSQMLKCERCAGVIVIYPTISYFQFILVRQRAAILVVYTRWRIVLCEFACVLGTTIKFKTKIVHRSDWRAQARP